MAQSTHTNKNRPNVAKVYSASELADLYGLTYSEVNGLIAKEMLTAVYVAEQEEWGNKPRYFLPLNPQNGAILEQQEMLKRCYRYTRDLEALVLDQVDNGEETLNALKEKNEVNTVGDLFGFTTYG